MKPEFGMSNKKKVQISVQLTPEQVTALKASMGSGESIANVIRRAVDVFLAVNSAPSTITDRDKAA